MSSGETSSIDDGEDEYLNAELEKFHAVVGMEEDPTMLVLRAHLFSESLLERLIRLKLPRGDRVLENGNFSYSQKLVLLEALDILPDSTTSFLRGLNKLRNQCAHELGRSLGESDVVRIGSPLGKYFTKTHRNNKYEPLPTFKALLYYVIGGMTGACHAIEDPAILERIKSSRKTD